MTLKTPTRNFVKNEKGGKVISVNLLDNSGEIRCTFFDELCDKHENIEVLLILCLNLVN